MLSCMYQLTAVYVSGQRPPPPRPPTHHTRSVKGHRHHGQREILLAFDQESTRPLLASLLYFNRWRHKKKPYCRNQLDFDEDYHRKWKEMLQIHGVAYFTETPAWINSFKQFMAVLKINFMNMYCIDSSMVPKSSKRCFLANIVPPPSLNLWVAHLTAHKPLAPRLRGREDLPILT